jgi:hypothetical protein
MEGLIVNMGCAIVGEPLMTVCRRVEIDESRCAPDFFTHFIYFELEEYSGGGPADAGKRSVAENLGIAFSPAADGIAGSALPGGFTAQREGSWGFPGGRAVRSAPSTIVAAAG